MPEVSFEKIAPAEAFAQWQAHRDRFAETGLWPVLVPAESVERIRASIAEQVPAVEEDIAVGGRLDAQAYLAKSLARRREEMEEDGDWDEEDDQDLDFEAIDPGQIERPPVEEQIFALREGGIALALVPCAEPWEVPAVLGYGGWNSCPEPAQHVAVLRRWQERHGAEPLVFGDDTVELLVRPLEDPEEAKLVAIEQYAYCEDIVDQGTDSVEELAATLLGAAVWFFWWD